ncbi:MAG: hypothetical protein KC910_12970 [Candidatus Eremiobacteraeota bacterium]|nr:hypothetical protein [Candidatus Eremiobacteraeota bacterium]
MSHLRHSLYALLLVFAFSAYSFDVECLLGDDVCPDSCQTQVSDACTQPLIGVAPQVCALPPAVIDYVAAAVANLTGRVVNQPVQGKLRYCLASRASSRGPPA